MKIDFFTEKWFAYHTYIITVEYLGRERCNTHKNVKISGRVRAVHVEFFFTSAECHRIFYNQATFLVRTPQPPIGAMRHVDRRNGPDIDGSQFTLQKLKKDFPCAAARPLPFSLILFPFQPSIIGLFGMPLQSHAPPKNVSAWIVPYIFQMYIF